jgi:hypothetical protein
MLPYERLERAFVAQPRAASGTSANMLIGIATVAKAQLAVNVCGQVFVCVFPTIQTRLPVLPAKSPELSTVPTNPAFLQYDH